MKWIKWLPVAMLVLALMPSFSWGAEGSEGSRPWQINNRLRLEWDDNIYQSESNEVDSIKIIEEIEFMLNFSLEQTFVTLRYRPMYVWWDERRPDRSDFNHDFDFVLNHEFSPRVSLSLTDTLRRGELPESEDENGMLVREDDTYFYNNANGTLAFLLRPATKLELGGRYALMRYSEDDASTDEDNDIYAGGLTLRQQLAGQTVGMLDGRYEGVKYDGLDRDSQSYFGGVGVESILSPSLVWNGRGGYQHKTFDVDDLDAENSPYGDTSLTLLPSPATRITAGAAYSLYEAKVYPFASQARTQAYLSFAHDLTARIALYLSGAYTYGQYEADKAVRDEGDEVVYEDGDEKTYQVSARGTYRLNRMNWLEAGWIFVKQESDYRTPYTENRLDIGWKISI